jgi:hypothetical protein
MNIDKINSIQLKQQAAKYVKFVQNNHCKPLANSKNKEEKQLYNWFEDFVKKDKNFEKNQEILQILEKVTTISPPKEKKDNYAAYLAFTQEHNKVPSYNSENIDEKKLAKWYYRLSYAKNGNEILKKLKEDIPMLDKKNTIDDEINHYIQWCNKYNSLPSGYNSRDQEERHLAKWLSLFKIKSKYKKYEKQAAKMQSFMEDFEKRILEGIEQEEQEEQEEQASSSASSDE